MPNRFRQIDDWLFERLFQPLADFLALRAGLSRDVVAGFCLDVASAAWILSRVPALSIEVKQWNAAASLTAVALLGLGLTALVSLRILFRKICRGQRGNPLRPAMRPHRAVALLLLLVRLTQLHIPHLSDVAEIVMLLFSTSALYLGACAERPPVHRPGRVLASAAG